jgi:hypothetical protein
MPETEQPIQRWARKRDEKGTERYWYQRKEKVPERDVSPCVICLRPMHDNSDESVHSLPPKVAFPELWSAH